MKRPKLRRSYQEVLLLSSLGYESGEIGFALRKSAGTVRRQLAELLEVLVDSGFNPGSWPNVPYLQAAAELYVNTDVQAELFARLGIADAPATVAADMRTTAETDELLRLLAGDQLPLASRHVSHGVSVRVVNAVPLGTLELLLKRSLGSPEPGNIDEWTWMVHLLDGTRWRWAGHASIASLAEDVLTQWMGRPDEALQKDRDNVLEEMDLLAINLGAPSRFERLGVTSLRLMRDAETRMRNSERLSRYYGGQRGALRNVVRVIGRGNQSSVTRTIELLKISALLDQDAQESGGAFDGMLTEAERGHLIATAEDAIQNFEGAIRTEVVVGIDELLRQVSSLQVYRAS